MLKFVLEQLLVLLLNASRRLLKIIPQVVDQHLVRIRVSVDENPSFKLGRALGGYQFFEL